MTDKKIKPQKSERITSLKTDKGITGLPRKYEVVIVSALVGLLFVGIGLYIEATKLTGVFLGLGVIVGILPYSYLSYKEHTRIGEMEENFPSFLRDIAEAKKTGMTLAQALYKSSKIDYGDLSPQIQKMSSQISWGIPFGEVMTRFSKRVKSEFISRAIAIIVEAEVSGGAITDTLDSVARDARLIKEAEHERKTQLSQQSAIMYAIFFLFVAIVISLLRLMIPLVTSEGFSLATENPDVILNFYRNLFFAMIVIQGIFSGLLAGQISTGSVAPGLKHSAIFLVSGVLISILFLF